MLNCPVGTMRTTVGAGAVTDCEPCTAGYYCLEESTGTTGSCLEGYYCPTNFTNPYGNDPPYIGSYGNDMVSVKWSKLEIFLYSSSSMIFCIKRNLNTHWKAFLFAESYSMLMTVDQLRNEWNESAEPKHSKNIH